MPAWLVMPIGQDGNEPKLAAEGVSQYPADCTHITSSRIVSYQGCPASLEVSCAQSAFGQVVLTEADLAKGGPEAEAHGAPSHDMEGAPQHADCVPYRHQLCFIWDACVYPAPCFAKCVKDVYTACKDKSKVLTLSAMP